MKRLVCYDISDDRIRNKVSNVLCNYLYRVQKSVFEGFCTHEEMLRLEQRLSELIDPTDTVRIYTLCDPCHRTIQILGAGDTVVQKQYLIL